jgi:hypothetical protein
VLSKIERFEDLIAWQKARDLTWAIYQVSRKGALATDLGLARQIQRLLAQAEEVGRVVGGFRAPVEKLGNGRRSSS